MDPFLSVKLPVAVFVNLPDCSVFAIKFLHQTPI